MSINNKKCECLHLGKPKSVYQYSIDSLPIPSVDSICDLGLTVDRSLSFRQHCSAVCSKARRLVGLIFRLFHCKDATLFIKFFNCYVIPLLDYCAVFYTRTSKHNIKVVERVQKRFLYKLFKRCYPRVAIPSYTERLGLFSLESLALRYEKLDLVTLYKILTHSLHAPGWAIQFSPRHPKLIKFPRVFTSLYRSSFFHRSLVLWNRKSKLLNLSSFSSFKLSINSRTSAVVP